MKKICLIILSLSLLVSIMPINIFASTNQERQQYKTSGIKMPTKKELAGVPNELEYIKQYLKDGIYEEYSYYKKINSNTDGGYYIPEIMSSIEFAYNNCIESINNATELEDLINIEESFFDIVFTGDLRDNYYAFMYLAFLNVEVVDSSGDFKKIKKEESNKLFFISDCFSINSYNNYYWSKIQGLIEESQDKINEQTSFYDFAIAITQIEDFIHDKIGDLGMDFLFFEIAENTDFYCPYYEEYFYEGEDEVANILDRFGIETLTYPEYGLYVYSNDDIKNLKAETTKLLNYYITKQIKIADYQGDINILKQYVDIANAKINGSYNVNEISNIYNKYEKILEKESGVIYKDFNYSAQNRIYYNVERIIFSYYNAAIYSEYSLEKIGVIHDTLVESMDYMQKAVEFPSNYEEILIELLEEIPTKAEELQAAKEKYINVLNKFKNNVKYNQTKVVPIVNEGIAKINDSTTITKAKSIYISYYKKARATIKKFNITTSKTGYGTITKSGIAKYGTNYTVRITPKKGYKIKKLYVDGKIVKNTTKYTFRNITKSHKIKVIFVVK